MPLEPLPEFDDTPADLRCTAEQSLRDAGAPSSHIRLLADALVDTVALEDGDLVRFLESDASLLGATCFRTYRSDSDAAMVAALLHFAGPHRRDPKSGGVRPRLLSPRGELRRLARLLPQWLAATPAIDVAGGLLRITKQEGCSVQNRCVFRAAARVGRLDLAPLLDLSVLCAQRDATSPDDRRGIWYWFVELGSDALAAMLPLVEQASEADAGPIAHTIVRSLTFHLDRESLTQNDVVRVPRTRHLFAWVQHIEHRLSARGDDLLLWATLWDLMRSDLTIGLGNDVERRLLDATQRRLSLFRRDVSTGAIAPDAPWSGHVEYYQQAILAVRAVGGHWKAMKAALLLHRALPVPSVGDDLRYWQHAGDLPESDGGPPTRWRWVPVSAVGIADDWAADEQLDDPGLMSMREELARYFLDRLRSRMADRAAPPASDDDMIESSPHWRRAAIQAVRALRVNPGRSGHHVLHWLRSSDPHEEIRQEAAVLHDEMVKRVTLPPGSSPLRAVRTALWWTRWASRRALGLPVDQAAANRTKQREMRRAAEVERRNEEQSRHVGA